MRILHTSDWHIGRTFHKYSTLEAAKAALGVIPALIAEHKIDVVVAAGDIFDSSNPDQKSIETLRDIFKDILAAGAKLMVTSGNHDSATRLSLAGAFSAGSGLHLFTEVSELMNPIELTDGHGSVDFYGIPFIEPKLHRDHAWMPENSLDQHGVITAAMEQVRAQIKARANKGRRSVVISHTFAAGGEKDSSDSERAITRDPLVAGGVDNVPVSAFKGADYVALGHIHGRSELAHNIRYSGAVVHYSFKEAGKARGGWLVDLEPGKDAAVEWVDFPIFRKLIELKGPFAEIMTKADYDQYADYYVRVVYTDNTRELDAMRKLKERFPYCAEVIFEPANVAAENSATYRDRIKGKTDLEIMSAFLVDVRNGEGPTKEELKVLTDALDAIKQEEAAK